ncbi:expressed protein [Echinococcus multilocularis]|uniref:Expressed protein n=1 Tax=Echinococcus multilocularis TaxID=6211 RepID=A0A068Y919_ECHMU|nr:expressed protein [Echinococcus multilocularis]
MDFFHFHPFLPFSFAPSRRTTHSPASINYTLSSTLSTLVPICKYICYKLMLHSNIYRRHDIHTNTHIHNPNINDIITTIDIINNDDDTNTRLSAITSPRFVFLH